MTEGRELQVCSTCQAIFRTGYRACPHDGTRLMVTTTDPLIGNELAGRYVVEKLLGDGGLGRVYKARHARMSRRYALKVLYGDVAYDPKVRTRFANEAEAASRLSHPNVVGVVDFGETEAGLLYIAMDLAEGRSLADIIAERGRLPAYQALRLFREITLGLFHAHDRGLIHRDLKPENIIIEKKGGQPRIVDFGLALLQEQQSGRVTTGGMVIGTPHYMAPEQATGEAIDQRTDLFSLGLVLYEMLAGVLPFEGPALEVARMNLTVAPPTFAERVPGLVIEPGLEALCMKLLAKRPRDRPENAQAVLAMIDRLGPQGATGRMDAKLTWIDGDDDGPGHFAEPPVDGPATDPIVVDVDLHAADPLGDTADPDDDELRLGEPLPGDAAHGPTRLAPRESPRDSRSPSPAAAAAAASAEDIAAALPRRRAGITEPPPLPARAERLPTEDTRGPLSTHELTAAVRPRRTAILLGLIGLAAVAVIAFLLVRNPDKPRATVPADAAALDAAAPDAAAIVVELDAGDPRVDAAVAPVDAGPSPLDASIARTTVDARPREPVDAGVPADAAARRPPIDAPTARPPIDAPAEVPLTATAVKAAYRKTGDAISALEAAGDPEASRLRKRWADLPLADALARPDRRAEFLDRLRALQAAVDAAK